MVDLHTAAYVWSEEPDGTRRRVSNSWSFFRSNRGITEDVPTRKYLARCKVYNLETEDYHTYYVGQHGVWVHNSNFKLGENGIEGISTLDPKVRTDRIVSP